MQRSTGEQELLSRAEEMVKAHMAKYDPSHDWAHVDRVRRMALKLAPTLERKPDMLVLELIALFHDMADAKYMETSSLSSILDPFLSHPSTYEHLSQNQIDLILKVIPCISYSTETKMKAAGTLTEWHATCQELLIAQDADRLDAIGGVGIMRCCAFSGAMGRTLLGKDKNTAEGHFYDKLVHVKDRMKTLAGKKEAEKRHQAMLDFLAALDREAELDL